MQVADIVSTRVEPVINARVPVLQIAGFDAYDFKQRGVTEQFLGDAETYFQKYTNPARARSVFEKAFSEASISTCSGRLRVLDIGTGGGHSVFAIRDILPDASVLGIDISRPLLEICSRFADERYAHQRGEMALLCADLYDVDVIPESVDFVTGFAILHHMLDPGAIVAKMLTALKPGGYAIFNEPFEIGHGILRGIFATILNMEEGREPLPASLKHWMAAFITDFDARRGIGHVREGRTKFLDDKWYFTDAWFRALGRQYKCDLTIIPTHADADIFWRHFERSASIHNGSDAGALPQWAKDVFTAFDESYSAQQLADLPIGGVVVMRKAG